MSVKFETSDDDLIRVIKESVPAQIIKIGEEEFTTKQIHRIPEKPLVSVIKCSTLTGIVDYINEELDIKASGNPFVVVNGPENVTVLLEVDHREDRRFSPIAAAAETPSIQYGYYAPQEDTLVGLQSRFVQTPDRDSLIQILSSLVHSEELKQTDDGMAQEVITQRGVRRQVGEIQNPYMLQPFRTFPEVEQPVSPFVVRLKKGTDGIQVALFEADGGAWKNAAMRSIKEYLKKELGANVSVIA